MRLVFTTTDYQYAGRPRPGFPIILADDMRPAQPFQDFLHHTLLGRGKSLDPKTWEAYGRRLWDFCRYLQANGMRWDEPLASYGESVVAKYRDWSIGDLGLNPKTLNSRLRLVVKFYEWARVEGLIERLPFGYDDVHVSGIEHDLKHIDGGQKVFRKPDVLENEWDEDPAFLTAEQLRIVRGCNLSTSREILFDLMARVGLRSCEARTFPLQYVFNPASRKDCKPGYLIEVRLEPQDMEIKYSKQRVVHVPYSLMERMHSYTLHERNRLASKSTRQHAALVLTVHGRPFSKDSVGAFCRWVGTAVGFRVAPLMLRHSYAIHTLMKLRDSSDFKGEPLLYVRDRLGHRSVQTTMVYLQQLERLTGGVALAMSDEFDRLFGVTGPESLPPDTTSVTARAHFAAKRKNKGA